MTFEDAALFARLAIIATLAYSGFAKLGAPVREAAENLGLYPRLARFVGQWLAPAELAVAALLIFSRTYQLAAIAALVMFTGFTALIAWNLWQGKKPSCACFGEASSEPISPLTLFRNLALVVLAGTLVASGPDDPPVGVIGGLVRMIEAFGPWVALSAIGLAQAATFLVLIAQRNKPKGASPAAGIAAPAPVEVLGWPPGTLAPSFDLPSLEGTRTTLQDLLARGRNVVIFFTAPGCRHCVAMFPEVARWQEEYRDRLTIILVSRGSVVENRAKVEDLGLSDFLLQGGAEVAEAYESTATPTAVVVDRNRRIASRIATGAVEIRHLIEAWAERSKTNAPVSVISPPPPADPTRLMVGEAAPPFKLPALRGGEVDLSDFAGRLAMVVFWSPTCGYCRRMAPSLSAREKEQTESSAQLIFLATGTRAANEAEAFVSPILLDEADVVGRAYGSRGTPSAVLIDAESKVASPVATGQHEIEALMLRADLLSRAARRVQA